MPFAEANDTHKLEEACKNLVENEKISLEKNRYEYVELERNSCTTTCIL
jgi:hypothetical protein